MIGQAYAKGVGGFNISKRQTFAGLLFGPKYYEVSIPEYLEEVEIEVNGPTAVLSMVKTDYGNAALTMSAMLAIDNYQGGRTSVASTGRCTSTGWLKRSQTGSQPRGTATPMTPTAASSARLSVVRSRRPWGWSRPTSTARSPSASSNTPTSPRSSAASTRSSA